MTDNGTVEETDDDQESRRVMEGKEPSSFLLPEDSSRFLGGIDPSGGRSTHCPTGSRLHLVVYGITIAIIGVIDEVSGLIFGIKKKRGQRQTRIRTDKPTSRFQRS